MNKFKYIILSAISALMLGSCNGFLDQTPDQIYTNDEMFGDANMIKSILANMYGRVTYGQSIFDDYSFTYIDEAPNVMVVPIIVQLSKMTYGELTIMNLYEMSTSSYKGSKKQKFSMMKKKNHLRVKSDSSVLGAISICAEVWEVFH